MSGVDTAKDLVTFASGPTIIGPLGVVAWARSTIKSKTEITSRKGWLAAGAGLLAIAWMIVFLVWAAPTVWDSWTADGDPNVHLVLLSATSVISIVLIALVVAHTRKLFEYLSVAYHADDQRWHARLARTLGP